MKSFAIYIWSKIAASDKDSRQNLISIMLRRQNIPAPPPAPTHPIDFKSISATCIHAYMYKYNFSTSLLITPIHLFSEASFRILTDQRNHQSPYLHFSVHFDPNVDVLVSP